MSGIFLSYRRDDASGWAGRLYEHLVREWGSDKVFMDIDDIAPGEDFREAIARTMDVCDVVLVVIGPNWLSILDDTGRRRLESETDTHRAEVIAALAGDVRVIPVLVGGAAMPGLSELPEPLRELAYRNAARIEDRRFSTDVEVLQRTLRRQLEHTASMNTDGGEVQEPPKQSGSRPSGATPGVGSLPAPAVLVGVGLVLVLVSGVFVQRGWHNEWWGIRVVASAALVVLATAGLRSRSWPNVLIAGAGGLLGLAMWLAVLVSTHGDELAELFGLGGDGLWNAFTIGGASMVAVGGWLGGREQLAGRSRTMK